MRQDDEDFSRKSKRYRKDYNDSVAALYGNTPPPVRKAPISRKVKRKIDPWESTLQINLVSWIKGRGLTVISIPNQGKRSYWQGEKEVAMGLTKGVSDLFITNPRSGYGGFWIELKRKGEKPRLEQLHWLAKMRTQGYMCGWYDDLDLAKEAIMTYLGNKG